MSDLREALEHFDRKKVLRDLGDVDVVVDAARRFLALTETGRRVEWCEAHKSVVSGSGKTGYPLVCDRGWAEGAVDACSIIPKLLADYLTEEGP